MSLATMTTKGQATQNVLMQDLTPLFGRENAGNGKIDLIGISFRYYSEHPPGSTATST